MNRHSITRWGLLALLAFCSPGIASAPHPTAPLAASGVQILVPPSQPVPAAGTSGQDAVPMLRGPVHRFTSVESVNARDYDNVRLVVTSLE